jgi:hypothetical protein
MSSRRSERSTVLIQSIIYLRQIFCSPWSTGLSFNVRGPEQYTSMEQRLMWRSSKPRWKWRSSTSRCAAFRFNDDVGSDVVFVSRFALDTTPVNVEGPIIAIGYAPMKAKPLRTTEEWLEFSFEAGWACNKGKVTAVYPEKGPSGQKGPCFQVDIPFKGGMSGGPIFTWDAKAPYVRGFVMMGEERFDEASSEGKRSPTMTGA